MTIPSERKRSLKYAREFLYDLLDPKKTPKVPLSVRIQARAVLRHFPWDCELERIFKAVPELFSNESIGLKDEDK